MAKHSHTAAYTTEFHHEFRAETGRLLVRRFMWFTAFVGAFGLISTSVGLVAALALDPETLAANEGTRQLRSGWTWLLSAVWLAGFIGAFLYVWRVRPPERLVLQISFGLVVLDGVLNVVMWNFQDGGSSMGLGGFFVTHLLACLFLPWSAWHALRPMIVVLAFNAVLALLVRDPIWAGTSSNTWLEVLFSPLLAVPGTLWCMVRHSRRLKDFRFRFVSSKYSEMRRELVDARRIHESLFPETLDDGPLRFAFEYEPMRQIGGDFLYAHCCDRERGADGQPYSVVLLDVTGHGIPAALTVNRLHGELERIFAENPTIGPGEVLRLLNRYVNLTLSSHSIYVTGMCMKVDCERGEVEYASGGHPPAFLRAVDGTVEDMPSTSLVLGACPDEAFDPAPRTLRFGPGDTILAYTDGAIEARDESGKMIRIDGIRRMIASAGERPAVDWPRVFREEVIRFRGGPPEDDTLLLVLHHALESAPRRRKPPQPARLGVRT